MIVELGRRCSRSYNENGTNYQVRTLCALPLNPRGDLSSEP